MQVQVQSSKTCLSSRNLTCVPAAYYYKGSWSEIVIRLATPLMLRRKPVPGRSRCQCKLLCKHSFHCRQIDWTATPPLLGRSRSAFQAYFSVLFRALRLRTSVFLSSGSEQLCSMPCNQSANDFACFLHCAELRGSRPLGCLQP